MKMEQLVIFDFVGKQEFQNYVENRLATDFAFHLSKGIIRKEKEPANKERLIDELAEALACIYDDFAENEIAHLPPSIIDAWFLGKKLKGEKS